MGIYKLARVAAIMILLSIFAFTLAGCGPKAVLLYDDSHNHFAAKALDRLNYSFVTVTTMEEFVTMFQSKAWDLLVMDNPSLVDGETGALPLINDFVTRGAKAVISSMNIGQYPIMDIWYSLGFHYEMAANPTPMSVYKVNPTLSIWKTPYAVPELDFDGADDLYPGNGFPGSAVGSGEILAVFSTSTPATTAAVIVANEGRTLLNSFFLDDGVEGGAPIDKDGDSIADAVEWWMNEIRYVTSQPGEAIMPKLNTM